jgi:hypothetical protein
MLRILEDTLMVKSVLKSISHFVNEDIINIYLKWFYNWQLKHKLLKKTDNIDKNYKNAIKNYWGQFNLNLNNNWHRWYSSRNTIYDVKYIPEDLFYCYIEPYYNKTDFRAAYQDKALYSLLYSNVKQPVEVVKNMSGQNYDNESNPISLHEVIERCINKRKIIIKPSVESGGGRNVLFIDETDKLLMREKVMNAVSLFGKDYVVQEAIEQHEDLSKIYPLSVNTIRTISFLFDGKVHILSSVLRMGVNGRKVDNGGIACGIKKDGTLNEIAIDKNGLKYEKHPDGFAFKNIVIPSYTAVLETIRREHLKLGHFKLVSWDFAVDKDGSPILIENNLRFEEINFHQLNNGPLFGELTDNVLKEVFGRM